MALLAPVAAMKTLAHLSPFEYTLLLRCAVPIYEHITSIFSFTSLALYLYFSFTLLLRNVIRFFPFFKNYINLILI
jgi:hypothetical protein